MSEQITARIAKLLSKAEATSNEHEAEAYMAKVQELVTYHQIELEHVRQAATKLNRPAAVPTSRRIVIGKRGTRGLKTYVALFSAIGFANGLRIDVAMNSTAVIPFGFAEDIDLTETMYNSLLIQMVTASEAYLNTGAFLREKVYVRGHYRRARQGERDPFWGRLLDPSNKDDRVWEDSEYRTPNRMTARISFQMAYAARVQTRLELVKAQTAAAMDKALPATGAALALRDREAAVELFHKDASDAKGSYWAGRGVDKNVRGATAAGIEAANTARLGTEQAIGGHRIQLAG